MKSEKGSIADIAFDAGRIKERHALARSYIERANQELSNGNTQIAKLLSELTEELINTPLKEVK